MNKFKITDLSKQIFWDTNISELDWEAHSAYIVERVLEYGLLEDWKLILEVYGLKKIIETSLRLRNLSPKTLSFLSNISGIDQKEFACYTQRQLNQGLWIY